MAYIDSINKNDTDYSLNAFNNTLICTDGINEEKTVTFPNGYNYENNMSFKVLFENGHNASNVTTVYTDGTNFYNQDTTPTVEPSGQNCKSLAIGYFLFFSDSWYAIKNSTWYLIDDFINNDNWIEIADASLINTLNDELSNVCYIFSKLFVENFKLNNIDIVIEQDDKLKPLFIYDIIEDVGGVSTDVYKVLQPNTTLELYHTDDYDGNGTEGFVVINNFNILQQEINEDKKITIFHNNKWLNRIFGHLMGKIWKKYNTFDLTSSFGNIYYCNNIYLTVGLKKHINSINRYYFYVFWSNDGKNWNASSLGFYNTGNIRSYFCYGNGVFVCCFSNYVGWSEDGKNWNQVTTPINILNPAGITYGNGKFIISQHVNNYALRSTDGKNWYSMDVSLFSSYYENNLWFICKNGDYVQWSDDDWGNWHDVSPSITGFKIYHGGNLWLLATIDGAYYSYDGKTSWTKSDNNMCIDFCYGNNLYVGCFASQSGTSTKLYLRYSIDGKSSWTTISVEVDLNVLLANFILNFEQYCSINYINGIFIFNVKNIETYYSNDGKNWQTINGLISKMHSLCYGDAWVGVSNSDVYISDFQTLLECGEIT